MKKLTGYKPLNLDEISDKRGIFDSIRDKIGHMKYGIGHAETFRSSRNYVPKKLFGKIEFFEFLEKLYSNCIL